MQWRRFKEPLDEKGQDYAGKTSESIQGGIWSELKVGNTF
jgi:hypothetical protein